MLAVTGRRARRGPWPARGTLNRIGIDSSAPTTAIGTTGTPGPHGDLDEAAAAEAAQLVALGVGLARPLRALGEHEHELLLLAQQAVGVVGVGGHAAERGPTACRRRAWS